MRVLYQCEYTLTTHTQTNSYFYGRHYVHRINSKLIVFLMFQILLNDYKDRDFHKIMFYIYLTRTLSCFKYHENAFN